MATVEPLAEDGDLVGGDRLAAGEGEGVPDSDRRAPSRKQDAYGHGMRVGHDHPAARGVADLGAGAGRVDPAVVDEQAVEEVAAVVRAALAERVAVDAGERVRRGAEVRDAA